MALFLRFFIIGLLSCLPLNRLAAQESALTTSCHVCEGSGVAEIDCVHCLGFGKKSCVTCTSWSPFAAAIDAAIAAAESQHLLAGTFRIHRVTPGYARCPANCDVMSAVYPWLKEDCPICDGKRELRCKDCKKGQIECLPCQGEGKLQGTCRRCVGVGQLILINQETDRMICPWCLGIEVIECSKHLEPPRKLSCKTCKSDGKVTCSACAGTKQQLCKGCQGRGKVSTGWNQPTSDCKQCKDGTADCSSCKKSGKMTCPHCKGDKKVLPGCGSCIDRKFPCAGCRPGLLASAEVATTRLTGDLLPMPILMTIVNSWVATADELLAQGEGELALAWIDTAIEIGPKRWKAEFPDSGQDKERQKWLDSLHERMSKRLVGELQAMRKHYQKPD